ncbi:MAG: hypothetical protein ABI873_08935 [Marmoricola sp.]
MSGRVFLHVGAPKTGTTYLQSALARNRSQLSEHGLSYPETPSNSHFEAAIDLTDHPWGGQLESARGEWDKLANAALKAPGDAVISHEVLAPATPEQVRRAQASLDGAELHVVYSARDLGRQIPAEWQENVKHRGRRRFGRFLEQVTESPRVGSDEWFWRVQGLPDVLSRWSAGMSPDRIHLITVPPPGAPPDLLWRRFAAVIGLDPDLELEPGDRANQSLGIAEIAMLRRLNMSLKGRGVPQPVYAAVVRDLIARDTLGRQETPQRATLPPESREFVDAVTAEWVEWVEGSGIDVVGDLAELQTRWPGAAETWVDPDRPRPMTVVHASVEALTGLILAEAERHRENSSRGSRRRFGR